MEPEILEVKSAILGRVYRSGTVTLFNSASGNHHKASSLLPSYEPCGEEHRTMYYACSLPSRELRRWRQASPDPDSKVLRTLEDQGVSAGGGGSGGEAKRP